ncbi:MAG TPA: hypothetical protein VJH71_00100 [Candidatus Paceibacterota bacterium]
MAETPQPKALGGTSVTAFSLKVPRRESCSATLVLIHLNDRVGLTEQDPIRNAANLCDYLVLAIDPLEITALRDQLISRFPTISNPPKTE